MSEGSFIVLVRFVTLLGGLGFGLSSCALESGEPPGVRFNEVQFIGSHNSYKQAIDPALLEVFGATAPDVARSLDYAHIPLSDQLELGLRKLELDMFYDPQGGLFATPAGLQMIDAPSAYSDAPMRQPGFKVLHVQDLDFRSHCQLLSTCLAQLVRWSERRPRHTPVVITINAKDAVIERPGFVTPIPYDGQAWRLLDVALRRGLGERLFTPDDLRGGAATLPAAIADGWPRLDKMLGKFIVVLDQSGAKLESYVAGHKALQGRAMFVNAPAGTPESAVLIINDPTEDFAAIKSAVQAGYLVRTRSDADTLEARQGSYARMQRAFSSGAQVISTDYYLPEPRFGHEFQVRFSDGTYLRCNPVLAPGCRLPVVD